jgi:minimal PKS acyl carrier protein
MNRFTLDELRELMRASAGVGEGVDLDGDIAAVPFADLGYDSLAVLELASQVQRRYGVSLPDEVVREIPTPAKAVEFINKKVEAAHRAVGAGAADELRGPGPADVTTGPVRGMREEE